MSLIEEHNLKIDGHNLLLDDICVSGLADEFGTPLNVYSKNVMVRNIDEIIAPFDRYTDRPVKIYYAVKACSTIGVLRVISNKCLCADIVSPYEGVSALDGGFAKERIMYTGTYTSDEDLEELLDLGIFLNIDSFSVLRRLNELYPRPMDISVRWNPGIGAGHTSGTITAGKEAHGKPVKFGIEEGEVLNFCKEARRYNKRVVGLHQHIGSGWRGSAVDDFLDTVDNTLRMSKEMTEFLGYDLDFVDFGGGPGIRYKEGHNQFPWDKYAKGICDKVKESGLNFKEIRIEPGRSIVGNAAVLLTRINTVETKYGNNFIGVDAGFHTLVRPAMYGSYHEIWVDGKADMPTEEEFTVVGPLCETGDILTQDTVEHVCPECKAEHETRIFKRSMPRPDEGDILVFGCAGAYGFTMSSNYNSKPRPAEVLIEDGKPRLIRRRETYDDLKRTQITSL